MSGSGRETHPDVLDWLRSPFRDALPHVREWLGGPPGCLGVVRVPPRYPGVAARPSRMSGSGRETLPYVGDAPSDVQERSGDPRISESSREDPSGCPEWSGDPTKCPGRPPECPGLVGRPSRMSGTPSRMSESGRGTLRVLQEWLVGPFGCPGMVGRPSQMFRSGRKALADVWE